MSDGLFLCPGCGNALNWLQRNSGQRVRCKCGLTLTIPASPGATAIAASPALAKSVKGAAAISSSRAAASSSAAAFSAPGEVSPYRHLFWPIVIVSSGLVLTVVYYATALPLSFATAMLVMFVRVVIDFVLLFAGCLLAMRMLDMALGEPVEALLKLAGIALLPAAVEGLIGNMLPGGFLLGWSLSIGLYGGLLMWFFTLSGKEVMTLTTIIWLVQSWAGLLLSAVLMQNVLGAKIPTDGPVGWILGQGSAPKSPADEADAAAEEAIGRVDTAEGNSWLMLSTLRSVRGRSHQQSQHLIGAFYNAHAPAVRVTDITAYPDKREIAADVIVRLPPDLPDREKVISIAKEAGLSAPVLAEQSYLLIELPATAK